MVLITLPATVASAASPVSFDAPVHYPLPASGEQAAVVAVGALRGGRVEDVVTGDNDGNITVFLNNGGGTFAQGVDYASGGAAIDDIAISDVNGDGNPDVIVAARGSGAGIYVLLGIGTGGLSAPEPVLNYDGGSGDQPEGLALGNFFGNGHMDLAVSFSPAGANGDALRVFRNDGPGQFTLVNTVGVGNTYTGGGSLATADLNSDGKPDLVENIGGNGVTGCGGILPLINNGSGGFTAENKLSNICSAAGRTAVADFNNDGRADIAAADSCSDFCGTPAQVERVYFGASGGSFPTSQDDPLPSGDPGSAVATDLNGDGLPDLVVTCSGSSCASSMQVFLNNGDGTFSNGPGLSGDSGDLAVGQLGTSCFPGIASVGPDLTILLNSQAGPCVSNGSGGGGNGGGGGGGGGGGSQACPFAEIPAPVRPDLSHKIFEKRLKSFSTTIYGAVSLNGGFGLGSPVFCSLNTLLNQVYGATDRKTHDKLALFPVTLGSQSLGVTLPITPEFKFDVNTLKFVDTNTPDWGAAPPNRALLFHWNGLTVTFGGGVNLKVEVEGHPGDFASLPSLEVPLLSVSAFTLGTQLINELPATRLYASLLLTPEGALSLNFSPGSLSTECEADAATFAQGGFAINLFDTTVKDAIGTALDAAGGVALREFPGVGFRASALVKSFGFVNDIVEPICSYSAERVYAGEAIGDLVVVGVVLAPAGVGDVVVLVDDALQGLKWTLVPPAVPAFASADVANVRPTMTKGPVRIGLLGVKTLRLTQATGLQLGPLPRSALRRAAHSVLAVDVAARVNRLLVTSPVLRPGKEITVVAAQLGKRTRRAMVTLVGPGYRALRVLEVHLGIAGGRIQLPKRMRPGRWTLAIVSYANVREHGRHVSGTAEMRLAIFNVHA